jgi:uncharacterized protein (DUF58 family)
MTFDQLFMLKILRNLYLSDRFFILFVGLAAFFVLSFAIDILYPVAQTLFVLSVALVLIDILILFNRNVNINCERRLPKVFSLGDNNTVYVNLHNQSTQKLKIKMIDELPFQFQRRDFEIDLEMGADEEKQIKYDLRPTERGEYKFGGVHLFLDSFIG